MGQKRKVYKVLVETPERRRPLGRPKYRWEDGMRKDFGVTVRGCRVDSVGSG
jgi:hypothetical protein